MASTSNPSRSTRRKTIPVPAAAGSTRSFTGAPLCNPTPWHCTGVRIVCSNDKWFRLNRLHPFADLAVLFFYNISWREWNCEWYVIPKTLSLGGAEIEGAGIKQAGGQAVVVTDGGNEILAVQLTVEQNQCVVRGIDSLYFFPVVVNFAEFIAVACLWIANDECFLDRQMSAGVDHQSDRLVLRVHDGHSLAAVVFCQHGAFIEQRGSGISEPFAQHNFQRLMPAQDESPQILVLIRIKQACASKGSLEGFVAHVDAYDVPLLGEFESLFVRPLPVAMNERAAF